MKTASICSILCGALALAITSAQAASAKRSLIFQESKRVCRSFDDMANSFKALGAGEFQKSEALLRNCVMIEAGTRASSPLETKRIRFTDRKGDFVDLILVTINGTNVWTTTLDMEAAE